MQNDITSFNVIEVHNFVSELGKDKYHKRKRQSFVNGLPLLSKESIWLLTVSVWLCLFNPRFKKIDKSRFYSVPAAANNVSTFTTFLSMLRHYEYKRVTNLREAELSKFLGSCDLVHQEFYLSVLSGDMVNAIPMQEAQLMLALDEVSIDDMYKEPIHTLDTSLGALKFPLILRTIPSESLSMCALYKTSHNSSIIELAHDSSKSLKMPAKLARDLKLSRWPTFVMVGMLGESGFYPFDHFNNSSYFREYLKGNPPEDFFTRWTNLNSTVQGELLTFVSDAPVALLESEDDLGKALATIMVGSSSSRVLITDADSVVDRDGKYFDARVAHGVIESMWEENGEALGFNVWFNGSLRKVPYAFYGKDNSLLNYPAAANKHMLRFFYLTVGGEHYHIGKEIDWRTPIWRKNKVKGTSMRVEKCVLCGGTDHAHSCRGMCNSCQILCHYHHTKNGVGVWITPSPHMSKKRLVGCWEPELLNKLKCRHKGYLLKANDKGDWGFFEDEESMRHYKHWKEVLSG